MYFRQTGMLEAVRVRREGFAYRPFFSDFFNDFRSISYYFTDKVQIIRTDFKLNWLHLGGILIFRFFFAFIVLTIELQG